MKNADRRLRSSGLLVAGLLAAGTCGCVPAEFGRATTYYVRRATVTDAAARRTNQSPYYRFDSLLLSDLDDALATTNDDAFRQQAAQVLRASNSLARTSTGGEIDRLPEDARDALVRHSGPRGGGTDAANLKHAFAERADDVLQRDLQRVANAPRPEVVKLLTKLRDGVEDLPDDKGRLQRQALLAWAALPVAIGIAEQEAALSDQCAMKINRRFDRIAIWRPAAESGDSLISRFAPVIGIEMQPEGVTPDHDRIGAVELGSDDGEVRVSIDTRRPMVYAYPSEAKIREQTFRQVNYVWWFPERPALRPDDPAAGPIDGATLRITLDAADRPAFIESSLTCGCSHEVFVAERVEQAAREVIGPPLPAKRFAVEKDVPGKHDVVVVDTFASGAGGERPLVLVAGGTHEVYQVHFEAPSAKGRTVTEQGRYRMLDYDTLDHLPLDGERGVASMFGADGLVHNAGRPEGYLLAPSGMLSAGQPRKRGTQRIRWDDYLQDDPRLLEMTLRIPPLE